MTCNVLTRTRSCAADCRSAFWQNAEHHDTDIGLPMPEMLHSGHCHDTASTCTRRIETVKRFSPLSLPYAPSTSFNY